jgi:hypothetical protein
MRIKRRRTGPESSEGYNSVLIDDFKAALKEDPWYDSNPFVINNFHVQRDFWYFLIWELVEHHKVTIELWRNTTWQAWNSREAYNQGKIGVDTNSPVKAVMRWYIAMREGKETVSEILARERIDGVEDSKPTRIKRSRP